MKMSDSCVRPTELLNKVMFVRFGNYWWNITLSKQPKTMEWTASSSSSSWTNIAKCITAPISHSLNSDKMVSVQVPTPTQATLIDYSETIIVVVAMIYFGGQHRPPSSDLWRSVFKLFKLGRLVADVACIPHIMLMSLMPAKIEEYFWKSENTFILAQLSGKLHIYAVKNKAFISYS